MMARWRSEGADCSAVLDRACAEIASLPFPFDKGKRSCILAKVLDLQNLLFLGFADRVHLIDETIGELL